MLMAHTCLVLDDARRVSAKGDDERCTEGCGDGAVCAAWGKPPCMLGYQYLLRYRSPSLTRSHLCQLPRGTLLSAGACSLSALGAQRTALASFSSPAAGRELFPLRRLPARLRQHGNVSEAPLAPALSWGR